MSISLAAMSLDCADPQQLAAFWRELLDGEDVFSGPDNAGVRTGGTLLVMQRVDSYRPPSWPGTSILHLDLGVDGPLQDAVERALSAGATEAANQYDERWNVLLDPAGHPFCLTTVTTLPTPI